MQRGINMVDLMMWLVIAAMLLAAALQGIGYYKQSSYIYQMKNDALHAAELVTAKAAQTDGSFTAQTVALGVSESTKTKDVFITPDEGSSDVDGYVLRTTHPEITDKDVLFLSAQRGTYSPGIHVVDKGTVIAPDGATSIDPELASGGGSTGGGAGPTPIVDTSSIMTTVWDTSLTYDNWGTPATCSNIAVPLTGAVDVKINWGDGSPVETFTTALPMPSHPYTGTPGEYTITIDGTFTGWVGKDWDSWSSGCITKVTSWGDGTGTVDGEAGFYNAMNLTEVARIPATMTVISSMFESATAFIGNGIENWDISNVERIEYIFAYNSTFNGDLSRWDTSSVTNMAGAFHEAFAFNGDVSEWDTSSVTNMAAIFYRATSFNGDVSQWDISNATNISYAFGGATSFNGDVSQWNTSSVTDMGGVFSDSTFNGDISQWDTSNAIIMWMMFRDNPAFNGDISGWETPNATNMEMMFQNATSFNQDLTSWVTKVGVSHYDFNLNSGLSSSNLPTFR
jgi:surface protein